MIAEASSNSLWYLLAAPLSVVATVLGIWVSQKGERQARADQARRLEDAIFGYTQGGTTVPGIQSVVVGDPASGRDSLAKVARDARDLSQDTKSLAVDNGEKLDETKKVIDRHVRNKEMHPKKAATKK